MGQMAIKVLRHIGKDHGISLIVKDLPAPTVSRNMFETEISNPLAICEALSSSLIPRHYWWERDQRR